MLGKQDVFVGKFYVNNDRRIAREVLRTSQQTVTFNTYHLDTGNSCGSSEASPTELAFLQYQVMDAQYHAADV